MSVNREQTAGNLFAEKLELTGGFFLPSRAVMSPMEGLMSSDLFFRIAVELGMIDCWMPPFIGIPAHAVPSPGSLRRKFRLYLESGLPFSLQLLGHDPEAAAESCRNAEKAGIRAVNFNFACPSGTVLSGGSGGALLKTPFRMKEMLSAARKAVPDLCISVKLRTGFASPEETENIMKAIVNGGADFAVCHFRTVSEGYRKIKKEEALRRLSDAVKAAGKLPVFGNGDILTEEDAFACLRTGCAGIAAARGLLRDPFLLSRLRGGSVPVPEEGRKIFLTRLKEELHGKKGAGIYAECTKMAYGENSEEFRDAVKEFSMRNGKVKDLLDKTDTL